MGITISSKLNLFESMKFVTQIVLHPPITYMFDETDNLKQSIKVNNKFFKKKRIDFLCACRYDFVAYKW